MVMLTAEKRKYCVKWKIKEIRRNEQSKVKMNINNELAGL